MEVDLRRGGAGAAEQWLRLGNDEQFIAHDYMLYNPVTTRIKALLALGLTDRADALLSGTQASAERTHNRLLQVQTLGLRALFCEAGGNDSAAVDALNQAVSLSCPGRGVRLLSDLGPALVGLLNRLDVPWEQLEHVGAILAAIGPSATRDEAGLVAQPAAALVDVPGMEPLTARKLDVLALLGRRYTNKEIARDLLIAPETVKKHSINLYRTLHVTGRREAVEKSRALGYLTDD